MGQLTKISAILCIFLFLINLFLFFMPNLIDFNQDNVSKYSTIFLILNIVILSFMIIVYLGFFQIGNKLSNKLLTFVSVVGMVYSIMMVISLFAAASLMGPASSVMRYLDLAVYALLALSFFMLVKHAGIFALLGALVSLSLAWSDIEQVINTHILSPYIFILLAVLALSQAFIFFKLESKESSSSSP